MRGRDFASALFPSKKTENKAYLQGILDLEVVHAGHSVSQDMDIIVVLEQVQGSLQYAHVRLNTEENYRLDSLELLLNLRQEHRELCLRDIDLCVQEIQLCGGGAQSLGVLQQHKERA